MLLLISPECGLTLGHQFKHCLKVYGGIAVICGAGREQRFKRPLAAPSLPVGKHPARQQRHQDTLGRESGTVAHVY